MYKLKFFWILVILTFFSWVSWYLILNNVSPVQSVNLAFPLMYISLFLSITFSIALLSSLLWKMFYPTKSSYICLKNGIRFGIIFGILFLIAMIFQQKNALEHTTILTLFLLGFLIETINIMNNKS
ncbi:TPA: hypothetical protein EYP45_00680 [Candidatus Peregrinibacteria bacterium]|nr:hypothetical protein [Candidatus Peregrinibacteria bacterium]HIQ57738.1 hypothetical protein [Candidatus Gracilibacteria bacterium]